MDVGVALDHVTDIFVAVSPGNHVNSFKNYDDSQEDINRLVTDLSVMFKELGFTKSVDVWCNHNPISLSLPIICTQRLKYPHSVELFLSQETAQEPNKITNYTRNRRCVLRTETDELHRFRSIP